MFYIMQKKQDYSLQNRNAIFTVYKLALLNVNEHYIILRTCILVTMTWFVTVNDLGVDLTGLGKNSAPVDEVVASIKAMGGTAVPNYGKPHLSLGMVLINFYVL